MPRLGGILILLSGGFDLLDGIVARTTGKVTAFGAFLDSVLDRYSDAALFIGIGIYLSENPLNILLLSLTFIGTFLISYVRARAEGLGLTCNVGLMERPERIILLAIGGIFDILIPVLWILFVFTHFTVLQRIYHVWKTVKKGLVSD
jgi:phosphatidylglycerophosphate synthase